MSGSHTVLVQGLELNERSQDGFRMPGCRNRAFVIRFTKVKINQR